ncbi:MAG TPA: flagellar basal body rod protein FlgC [Candidatus Limnocylindria bacterium]|jgi:flagellar basal-body rod protein FlgC|nr:flagellar basal body rod protein FlgC [Candidatus Limnocylindria bacterium]
MINLLSGIQSTSSALEAERVRMEVVSQNIANAQVTHGADGKPYQRQQVAFESVLDNKVGGMGPQGGSQYSVRVSRIDKDQRPFQMVFRPGHPDADKKTGMVAMPNINIHEEMVDMIASSRAFEANLMVVKNSRQMAMQAMSIGKH